MPPTERATWPVRRPDTRRLRQPSPSSTPPVFLVAVTVLVGATDGNGVVVVEVVVTGVVLDEGAIFVHPTTLA